eukprot:Gb_22019 [translate_table: standard]
MTKWTSWSSFMSRGDSLQLRTRRYWQSCHLKSILNIIFQQTQLPCTLLQVAQT